MNTNDPFSSVRLKSRQMEQPTEDVSNRNNSSAEDPFSDVRLKKLRVFLIYMKRVGMLQD